MSEGSGDAEVRVALEGAEAWARKARAGEVLPEHLLLALSEKRPGAVGALFQKHKVTQAALAAALPEATRAEGSEGHASNGAGPLLPSPELAALLSRALARAHLGRRERTGALDLVQALLDDRGSVAATVLEGRFGISEALLARAIPGSAAGAEAGPMPPAGLPGDARASGVSEPPPGGVGLLGEVRAIDLKLRMLEARIDAISRRQGRISRRTWLLILLVLLLAAAYADPRFPTELWNLIRPPRPR